MLEPWKLEGTIILHLGPTFPVRSGLGCEVEKSPFSINSHNRMDRSLAHHFHRLIVKVWRNAYYLFCHHHILAWGRSRIELFARTQMLQNAPMRYDAKQPSVVFVGNYGNWFFRSLDNHQCLAQWVITQAVLRIDFVRSPLKFNTSDSHLNHSFSA